MQDLEAKCLEHGLRMTAKRRAICRALAACGDHPDVEQIYLHASAIEPKISRGTVYRALNAMQEAGILARQSFGERRARYEEAAGASHHHLIDLESGKVIEFQSAEVEALNQRIAQELGYRLTTLKIELYGVSLETREMASGASQLS
jgi:Fur family transcriptional regulator, ferric uptake regulator